MSCIILERTLKGQKKGQKNYIGTCGHFADKSGLETDKHGHRSEKFGKIGASALSLRGKYRDGIAIPVVYTEILVQP